MITIQFADIDWENINKEAELYVKLKDSIDMDYTLSKRIQDKTWSLYKRFYKLHIRNENWLNNYRNILDLHMRDKNTDFEKIIKDLDKENVEASFASKLIHTVDNSKPIYDTNVRYALAIGQVIGDTYDIRRKQATILYNQIETFYKKEEHIKIREKIVKEFDDRIIQMSDITKEKKIDFVLWELGKERRFLWELEY